MSAYYTVENEFNEILKMTHRIFDQLAFINTCKCKKIHILPQTSVMIMNIYNPSKLNPWSIVCVILIMVLGSGTSFEYNGAVHVINLGLYLPREMCFWH